MNFCAFAEANAFTNAHLELSFFVETSPATAKFFDVCFVKTTRLNRYSQNAVFALSIPLPLATFFARPV
jgi:hypothetical protein